MRKVVFIALCLSFCVSAHLALAKRITIPAGTLVELELEEMVTSRERQFHVGAPVRCRVWSHVMVGNHAVVPAGTLAVAIITRVDGAGTFGKDGFVAIQAKATSAVDGSEILLDGEVSATGGRNSRGGMLSRLGRDHAMIQSGTRIHAVVQASVLIDTSKTAVVVDRRHAQVVSSVLPRTGSASSATRSQSVTPSPRPTSVSLSSQAHTPVPPSAAATHQPSWTAAPADTPDSLFNPNARTGRPSSARLDEAQEEVRYLAGVEFRVQRRGDVTVGCGWPDIGRAEAAFVVLNESNRPVHFVPERITLQAQLRNGRGVDLQALTSRQYSRRIKRRNSWGSMITAGARGYQAGAEGADTGQDRTAYVHGSSHYDGWGNSTFHGSITLPEDQVAKEMKRAREEENDRRLRAGEMQRIEAELAQAAFSQTVDPGTAYGGSVGFELVGGIIKHWKKPAMVRVTVPIGGESFVFNITP